MLPSSKLVASLWQELTYAHVTRKISVFGRHRQLLRDGSDAAPRR